MYAQRVGYGISKEVPLSLGHGRAMSVTRSMPVPEDIFIGN